MGVVLLLHLNFNISIMKKLLFSAAVVVGALMSAQTEKGHWMISGSTTLGFNNNTVKYKDSGYRTSGPKVSTIKFKPDASYFIKDNFAIGAEVSLANTVTKEVDGDGEYKTTQNTLSIIPQVTYYFPLSVSLKPYLGVGAGYATSKIKSSATGTSMDEIFDSETKISGLNWKIKGGVTYFIKSNIGINLGLEYNQITGKNDAPYFSLDNNNNIVPGTKKINTRINDFGVNVGVSFIF